MDSQEADLSDVIDEDDQYEPEYAVGWADEEITMST